MKKEGEVIWQVRVSVAAQSRLQKLIVNFLVARRNEPQ